MSRYHAAYWLGVIALLSCAPESNQHTAFQAADSAGVRIATSTAQPSQFDATSVVSIGSLSGDEASTFNRVDDVEVHPSGIIFVLDAGDNLVKAYDWSGQHLYSLGGKGEGPGEFLSASNLMLWSDTVAVFDWRLQKVAKFGVANGMLHGTESMPYSVQYAGFPTASEHLSSGSYLMLGQSGCALPRQPTDARWRVYLAAAELGITDTIADLPRGNSLTFYGEGNSFCGAPLYPFGASPVLAASQGRLAVAMGDRGEIWVYDRPGDLQAPAEMWRYEVPDILVTEEDRSAYEKQAANATPHFRAAFRKALAERGFPRAWPSVTRLLFDDEGRVWAQRGGPGDSSYRLWDVLSVEGQHVATLRFPSAVSLHAVGNGHAVGIRRDELEVQYVELFEIPDLGGTAP